jgi:uncharacterized MAPEG superfamily protein
MTIELAAAAVVLALGLVQVGLQAGVYRQVHGVAYANTAKDAPSGKADSPLLGRLTRALSNLHETLSFFLGAVFILALADVSTPVTRWAAVVYAAARILYVPLYALGVPYVRGLVWTVSAVAIVVLVGACFAAIDWAALLTQLC